MAGRVITDALEGNEGQGTEGGRGRRREGGRALHLKGLDDVGGLGGGPRGVGGGEAVGGLSEGQVVNEGGDVHLGREEGGREGGRERGRHHEWRKSQWIPRRPNTHIHECARIQKCSSFCLPVCLFSSITTPVLPPCLPAFLPSLPSLPTCVTARPSSARTLTAVGVTQTNSRPSPGMWLYTPSSRACSSCGQKRGGKGGREGGKGGGGDGMSEKLLQTVHVEPVQVRAAVVRRREEERTKRGRRGGRVRVIYGSENCGS